MLMNLTDLWEKRHIFGFMDMMQHSNKDKVANRVCLILDQFTHHFSDYTNIPVHILLSSLWSHQSHFVNRG
jgi:hypothetical protein